MKYVLICLIALLPVLTGCDKSTLRDDASTQKITGKWNYTQRYFSPGAGFIYESTVHLQQYIDFKADSSFDSNMPEFKNITRYQLLDSTTIRLTGPSPQPALRYRAFLKAVDHSLDLSSLDYICIEGCGNIFRK